MSAVHTKKPPWIYNFLNKLTQEKKIHCWTSQFGVHSYEKLWANIFFLHRFSCAFLLGMITKSMKKIEILIREENSFLATFNFLWESSCRIRIGKKWKKISKLFWSQKKIFFACLLERKKKNDDYHERIKKCPNFWLLYKSPFPAYSFRKIPISDSPIHFLLFVESIWSPGWQVHSNEPGRLLQICSHPWSVESHSLIFVAKRKMKNHRKFNRIKVRRSKLKFSRTHHGNVCHPTHPKWSLCNMNIG